MVRADVVCPSLQLLVRLSLQRFHIGVGEPEMVPDLVDHHVAHQMGQVLARLAPIGEDRLAVEKYPVLIVGRVAHAFPVQRNADSCVVSG